MKEIIEFLWFSNPVVFLILVISPVILYWLGALVIINLDEIINWFIYVGRSIKKFFSNI